MTNPERRAYCAPVRDELSANDGLKDLDKVKASVFITHGVQDENVRADHFSKWWYGLKERGVPRKLWILRQGHVDPFDNRRAVWVDTIHRWFDHWLYDVPNGIMSEPAVDIEESANNWKSYADWPIPGTTVVDYALPTATDNDDPSPDVVCTPASGTTFAVGQTRVTCTATDAQGNSAAQTFTVTVNGAQTAGGTVPATLSLTLGAPATFGTFTPGVAKDYTATTSANIVSTAGDASLSVNDPGRMTNGAFALPQPLQVSFSKSAWSAPTSNESVTITFKQPIGAHDPLRTGTYSRTLTFTLSTTNP